MFTINDKITVTSSEISEHNFEICSNFSGFELIPKPTATAHTTIARTPPLLLNADTKLFGTALIRINNGLLALLPVAASRPVSTDLKKPAL